MAMASRIATRERVDPLASWSSETYFSFSKSPMLQLLSKYAFVGA
jgi:hypothetical protein